MFNMLTAFLSTFVRMNFHIPTIFSWFKINDSVFKGDDWLLKETDVHKKPAYLIATKDIFANIIEIRGI